MRLLIFAWLGAAIQGAPQVSVNSGNIAEQLNSANCVARAWGAYNAAEANETKYASLIVPILNDCDARVQTVALDGLIRLHADVPEDSLRQFIETGQIDPIVMVYANNPKPHGALLMRLLEGPLTEPQRAAISTLLASSPPPGFAARLLEHWKIRYVVTVHDDAPFIGDTTGSGVGSVRNSMPGIDEPGYPPVFVYRLELYSFVENAVILLKEPRPIYYVREQSRTYLTAAARYAERDEDLRGYLAFMAHYDAGERPSFLPEAPILKWDGVRKYQMDVVQFLNLVRSSVRKLKDNLIAAGVLSEREAGAGPKLEVSVRDKRGNRSVPLPNIDWQL